MHIQPTTEIIAAIITPTLTPTQIKNLKTNPQKFIQQNSPTPLTIKCKILITQNTPTTINLTLPYYETLEELHAHPLIDASLEDAHGGEILMFAGALIGGVIGSALGYGIMIPPIIGASIGAVLIAVTALGTVLGLENQERARRNNASGSKK